MLPAMSHRHEARLLREALVELVEALVNDEGEVAGNLTYQQRFYTHRAATVLCRVPLLKAIEECYDIPCVRS